MLLPKTAPGLIAAGNAGLGSPGVPRTVDSTGSGLRFLASRHAIDGISRARQLCSGVLGVSVGIFAAHQGSFTLIKASSAHCPRSAAVHVAAAQSYK